MKILTQLRGSQSQNQAEDEMEDPNNLMGEMDSINHRSSA